MTPVGLLTVNASAQFVASSLLGFYMLLPRQPWLKKTLRLPKVDAKAMLSTHLDLIMLALMQLGAAFAMWRFPVSSLWAAWLLVVGGWLNPIPYLLRGLGIDAFVLAGPPRQRFWAAVSGLSALGVTAAWVIILVKLVSAGALSSR